MYSREILQINLHNHHPISFLCCVIVIYMNDITDRLTNGIVEGINVGDYFFIRWMSDRWNFCDGFGSVVQNKYDCIGCVSIEPYNMIAIDSYVGNKCTCNRKRNIILQSVGLYQGSTIVARSDESLIYFFPNVTQDGILYKIIVNSVESITEDPSVYFTTEPVYMDM